MNENGNTDLLSRLLAGQPIGWSGKKILMSDEELTKQATPIQRRSCLKCYTLHDSIMVTHADI